MLSAIIYIFIGFKSTDSFCVAYGKKSQIFYLAFEMVEFLKRLSRLVSNSVPGKTEFDHRQFHVRFVVQKGALREVFLRLLLFPLSVLLYGCSILSQSYVAQLRA